MLKFEIYTSDEVNSHICEEYWRTQSGYFVHKVEELRQKYVLPKYWISDMVRENSRAYVEDQECTECGERIYYYLRKDYFDLKREVETGGKYLCSLCKSGATKIRALLAQDDSEEREPCSIVTRLRDAKRESDYLLIKNFLCFLGKSDNIDLARRRMGLNKLDALRLLEVMNRYGLIEDFSGLHGEVSIPDSIQRDLDNTDIEHLTHSIHKDLIHQEAYSLLSSAFNGIQVNVKISDFIPRHRLEDVFTECWHESAFLEGEVDFAFFDYSGVPYFTIDYCDNAWKTADLKRMSFKEKCLNRAGLAMYKFSGIRDLEDLIPEFSERKAECQDDVDDFESNGDEADVGKGTL